MDEYEYKKAQAFGLGYWVLYLFCKSDDIDMFCSDKLAEMIAEEYKKIAPIYYFFMKADELTV